MHKRPKRYVLHIGARPHDAHVRHFGLLESKKRATPEGYHRSTGFKIWLFLWDKIKFISLSLFIFAIIYTALNWQALLLNAQHYYSAWRGGDRPLESLVQKKIPRREAFISQAAAKQELYIPPLNIEVAPPDTRLIIPRINQNVPIIGVRNENLIARKWEGLEQDIQSALRNGVIHYPGTALPGEGGNVVVTGHSSYYAWDPGRFKDVFALLHDVRLGDRIVVYFNQKKYLYEIANRVVVLPSEVDVLSASKIEQLTLITCTPIGTNLKRLVLTAKLVSVE